jgi:hypothetical protein
MQLFYFKPRACSQSVWQLLAFEKAAEDSETLLKTLLAAMRCGLLWFPVS